MAKFFYNQRHVNDFKWRDVFMIDVKSGIISAADEAGDHVI